MVLVKSGPRCVVLLLARLSVFRSLSYRIHMGSGVVGADVVGVGGSRLFVVLAWAFRFPYRSQMGSGVVAGAGAVRVGGPVLVVVWPTRYLSYLLLMRLRLEGVEVGVGVVIEVVGDWVGVVFEIVGAGDSVVLEVVGDGVGIGAAAVHSEDVGGVDSGDGVGSGAAAAHSIPRLSLVWFWFGVAVMLRESVVVSAIASRNISLRSSRGLG